MIAPLVSTFGCYSSSDRHSSARKRRNTRLKCISCAILSLIRVTCASAGADPWADEVVDASAALDGSGLYTDPESVLGEPTRTYYDNAPPGGQFLVSLVAGAFNLDAPGGNKVITTIESGQFIKVRFNEPVTDDPRNPFGVDLIVFGNSFFISGGSPTPDTDMAAHFLLAAMFAEPVTVAVSASGVGSPVSDPEEWYEYDAGPFADGLFPTNAYEWNRQTSDWGDPLDYTLPADPSLTVARFGGLSAASAIDLYECSGGGTGYNLAPSGLAAIEYVYLTSGGGEVDALADVFASLGDFDRDGDVDLRDWSQFQNCFDPQHRATFPCVCRSADFDGGHEADLADHADMASFMDGPIP